MTNIAPEKPPGDVSERVVALVDCDFHPEPISYEEVHSYLPEPARSAAWSTHYGRIRGNTIYPTVGSTGNRGDAWPPGGGPPGSDPAFAEREIFGQLEIDYVILLPLVRKLMPNPEDEAAICTGTNAWLADTWLGRYNAHGRYRGSISVCADRPDLAVAEIERWAGHPYFVQILMIPQVRSTLGQATFHPIYEAAARHGLPVALHSSRTPGMPLLTPVGFASYYLEHHAEYPLLYAPHLVSFIMEGVFDKFPNLRVAFVEGGMSWAAPLMWRLDRHWEEYRSEVPQVKRRPSEYVLDHVRLTTQPIEEPSVPKHLTTVMEWMDAARIVMFSTDYPHWDFDDPRRAVRHFPTEAKANILGGNAVDLYGLPKTRKD